MKNNFWDVTGICKQLVTNVYKWNQNLRYIYFLRITEYVQFSIENLILFFVGLIQVKEVKNVMNVELRKHIFS